MQRIAAILLIVGSIGFIGGAFLLAPTGFFEAVDDAGRIAAIENNRGFWTMAWLVLPTGGMIAAFGMIAQARYFQQTDNRKWLYRVAYVVAVAATIGAFTYVINGFGALTQSPERYIEFGNSIGTIMFMTYTVTTLLAVTTFGILFFLRKRRILGGFLVVAVILSIISGMWFIPLTSYAPLFIAGLVQAIRPDKWALTSQESEFNPVRA